MKILVAEDDPNLGFLIKEYLTAKGHETHLSANGKEGLVKFFSEKFEFCILDIMMPVMDGFTLAREIRKKNQEVPLLFLTAKSLQDDRIEGLRLGADDYITKPFSMEELLLRINAIGKRVYGKKDNNTQSFFRFGKCEFDSIKQILLIGKKQFPLTSKETELLKMFCLSVNTVVDRSEILKAVWGDDSYFNARSMDVFITRLRKYLKNDTSVEIMNVHGRGFKLVVTASSTSRHPQAD